MRERRRRTFLARVTTPVLAVFFSVFLAHPVIFLGTVWWRDLAGPLPEPAAGRGDHSRLEENHPLEVIPAAADPAGAERQLGELVQRARREHLKISVSGARHSQGGHTLYPGGLAIDMLPFHGMSLDEKNALLTVGAGARWSQVVPFLDQRGFSVAIMQSNNDFSVGGSLSVNCHGWQPQSGPIVDSVESFRLLTADGTVANCSRTEHADLFALAIGGYGLFGIILDVRLRVVPNAFYRAASREVTIPAFAQAYETATRDQPGIGMAYGRIGVAPGDFLRHAMLVVFKKENVTTPARATLTRESPRLLERLVFRGSVGSDYGKTLCWWLQTWVGGAPLGQHSRNQILNTPTDWFADRETGSTEILHEYFVPPAELDRFIAGIRPVLLRRKPDLLNITVRKVCADRTTVLSYAPDERFGLVMYFHEKLGSAPDLAMRDFTREMIDVVLACHGTYYLPYRAHASVEQFQKGYPQARAFFASKQRDDPEDIFENRFFLNYGVPLQ